MPASSTTITSEGPRRSDPLSTRASRRARVSEEMPAPSLSPRAARAESAVPSTRAPLPSQASRAAAKAEGLARPGLAHHDVDAGTRGGETLDHGHLFAREQREVSERLGECAVVDHSRAERGGAGRPSRAASVRAPRARGWCRAVSAPRPMPGSVTTSGMKRARSAMASMSAALAPRARPSATARTTSRRSNVEFDAVSPSGPARRAEEVPDFGAARGRPALSPN